MKVPHLCPSFLTEDTQPSRLVYEVHSCFHLIHILPTRTTGPSKLDLNVVGIDLQARKENPCLGWVHFYRLLRLAPALMPGAVVEKYSASLASTAHPRSDPPQLRMAGQQVTMALPLVSAPDSVLGSRCRACDHFLLDTGPVPKSLQVRTWSPYLHIHIIHFRHDSHSCSGGVHTPSSLCSWHSLHAVNACFPLELAVHGVPDYLSSTSSHG